MPSILNLKFKGNKSFVAFSNLNDTESLTKTWKVCTKVASYLEQGQRLENLSWRLWHLQNLMVDTDNAKSKREFKKLSKCMGDKLDKEKGRSIEELEAPDFKRNHSTEMIKQRAIEKERSREASQNAQPGTIKRMQFTFSVDQPPQPVSSAPVKKPDMRPSAELSKRQSKVDVVPAPTEDEDAVMDDEDAHATTSTATTSSASSTQQQQSLRFPDLFKTDFGPSALLYAAPTLTTRMNYGEGLNPPSLSNDSFSISRPTIELAIDDLLYEDSSSGDDESHPNHWSAMMAAQLQGLSGGNESSVAPVENSEASSSSSTSSVAAGQQSDVVMSNTLSHHTYSNSNATSNTATSSTMPSATPSLNMVLGSNKRQYASLLSGDDDSSYTASTSNDDEDDIGSPAPSTARRIYKHGPSAPKEILPDTVVPSRVTSAASIYGTRSNTPTNRPTLTLRTQTTQSTRNSGPSATATSLNPAVLRGSSGLSNSAPGGVKAECSNCGATHTPLWRRGLNDELNCNACGLYCKLHKRPRPKTMRNSHGEGRSSQAAPRPEATTVDVMGKWAVDTKAAPLYSDPVRPSVAAQCYNCHTTATPLWRKDDEGKTVCNACGLYYKLHGSARPISMKSDVIRKRSRHDARRGGAGGAPEDTPSASPGVSRRTSPVPEASPTLAPDSTTQMSYEFSDAASNELLNALSAAQENANNHQQLFSNPFQAAFPGPYHPDYLTQLYNLPADALPFSTAESNDTDLSMSPRSSKRRRMSNDSASEPPSSAVSFSSFSGDGSFSSASSVSGHSKHGSMDFSFAGFTSQGPALRGSGNTFWHPPMMPQSTADSEQLVYPPMTSGSNSSGGSNEDSPMDYLHHPPMALHDDEQLFSAYLQPSMSHDDKSHENNGASSMQAMYAEYY
jgi:GATA-binding protein